MYNKIIFVCVGNTCRSPMAATIMLHFLPEFRIESRGMVVLFPEPYNPKAVAVAARHNMIMHASMKQKIYDTYNEAINVYTLSEYAGVGDYEVADPYGRGIDEYNKCFEELYSLVEKAAQVVKKNIIKEND